MRRHRQLESAMGALPLEKSSIGSAINSRDPHRLVTRSACSDHRLDRVDRVPEPTSRARPPVSATRQPKRFAVRSRVHCQSRPTTTPAPLPSQPARPTSAACTRRHSSPPRSRWRARSWRGSPCRLRRRDRRPACRLRPVLAGDLVNEDLDLVRHHAIGVDERLRDAGNQEPLLLDVTRRLLDGHDWAHGGTISRPTRQEVAPWPSSPPPRGILLAHFIVSDDVERSRRFYSDVLGGETVRRANRRTSRSPTAGSSSTSAAARPTTSRRSRSRRRTSRSGQQLPQHPRRRHRGGLRRVERAGSRVPDSAETARDRDPLLHPRSGWLPDRGRPNHGCARLGGHLPRLVATCSERHVRPAVAAADQHQRRDQAEQREAAPPRNAAWKPSVSVGRRRASRRHRGRDRRRGSPGRARRRPAARC